MKLRYFIADDQGQLRKVSQGDVRGLWEGKLRADDLGSTTDNELPLVSVVCDGDLLPEKVFLLRLPLTEGAFTTESHLTLHLFTQPDCVTHAELTRHHATGWPVNFLHQLAVALDVPVAALQVPFAVGGPLFLAAALRVSPRQALRYLR